MRDENVLSVMYALFLVFFMGAMLYGFFIEQYVMSVIAAGIAIYLAKEFVKETNTATGQERVIHDLLDDAGALEKNQQDISRDAYPHVPFLPVHRIDYNYYLNRIGPKINGKSTRVLMKRILSLSRHVDSMHDVISYLRQNVNDQYLVNVDMSEDEIHYEIRKLENMSKTIRYDEKTHIALTKLLIRLHKTYLLKHRHMELMRKNEHLAAMLAEIRQEAGRFVKLKG